MSNLLMSRKEVAEYLGVTPQTVSNWINKGIIKAAHDEGRAVYVSRAVVEKFADDLRMTSDDENKIREYVNMKHEEKKHFAELWGDMNTTKINRNQLNSYIEIVQLGVIKAFELCGDKLTGREKGIIKKALALKPTTEIAEEYNVSRTMVNHLIRRVLVKMKRLESVETYTNLANENAQLNQQVKMIKERNEQMKNLFIAAIQGIDIEKSPTISDANIDLLATKIENIGFSRRLTNACRRAGYTLGDVIQYRYDDLCKLRNMGKKSMDELIEFMGKYGLKFGNKRIE